MCSVTCTGQRQMRRAMSLCDSAESLHRLASSGKAVHSVPKLRKAPRDRRAVTRSAAASPRPRSSPAERWSTITTQLVASSTLPFLLLLWPQLIKNARNLQSNPEALGGLSWLSYLLGLFGNSLLLAYFTTKREMSAVLVQAIGIASSFAVLTQIRVAGFIPRAVYAGIAVMVAAAACMTALKLGGWLDGSKEGQALWGGWQKVQGLAGLAVVPQVLWSTFGGASTLAPGLTTLGLGCAALALDSVGRLPPPLQSVWAGLSAYMATGMFILQPVAQLVRNFQDPTSLAGLSVATILLAAAGNALMVPRALFVRDYVWLLGSMWGSLVFGWAQMLSMWLGGYLATPPFMLASLLLCTWFAGVLWADRRAKRAASE